jgi:hypothetical protein
MSDMIKARTLMREARTKTREAIKLMREANELNMQARDLTFRNPAVRRAPAHEVAITSALRQQVLKLIKHNPTMTYQQVAVAVGLRNGGRVSEILTGKR